MLILLVLDYENECAMTKTIPSTHGKPYPSNSLQLLLDKIQSYRSKAYANDRNNGKTIKNLKKYNCATNTLRDIHNQE
jgi:hypothetical protein